MTQSSCKRDTKSKSHLSVKLAPVRVFSCNLILSLLAGFVQYNQPEKNRQRKMSHVKNKKKIPSSTTNQHSVICTMKKQKYSCSFLLLFTNLKFFIK